MPMINGNDFCEIIQGEIEQCEDEPQKLADDFITSILRSGEMDGYEDAINVVQEIRDDRR